MVKLFRAYLTEMVRSSKSLRQYLLTANRLEDSPTRLTVVRLRQGWFANSSQRSQSRALTGSLAACFSSTSKTRSWGRITQVDQMRTLCPCQYNVLVGNTGSVFTP